MKSLLGMTVKDSVSGFKGVVVAEYNYLNGCTRCCIQPWVDEKGKLPATATFDLPQLVELKKKKAKIYNITGGPEKYTDIRKY